MSVDVQNAMFIFVAVAALALFVQTVAAIVLLLIARKAARGLTEQMDHYRATLTPLIERAREAVDNVAPKVESAADELVVVATRLRQQSADLKVAADDIVGRAQRQARRIDRMVTTACDGVERAGVFLSESVARPVRQVSGIVAAVKAAVDRFRDSAPTYRPPR